MPIAVQCPKGHVFHTPDYLAGGQVRCPRCFRPVTVPGSPPVTVAGGAALKRAIAARAATPARHVRRTRWLAAAWVVLAIGQCWPAVNQVDLTVGPAWAKAVVVVALLQLAFAAALANVPDWSSLWAALVVLAAVAASYALCWAMALFASPTAALLGELDQVRAAARVWCGGVTLTTLILAYACGRIAVRWHREEVMR